MTNQSPQDERTEREWVKPRFRDYVLGRLSDDDTERLTGAVAIYAGLIDQLDDAEGELIDAYLDHQLSSEEQDHFERQYVHTRDLDNRAKLELQRALRSQDAHRAEARQPSPGRTLFALPRPVTIGAAVAAAVLIAVFAGLYYAKSRQLAVALAELKSKQTVPVPRNDIPPERPAGSSTPDGLILSARISGTGTVAVAAPPSRLIWAPVPDYRERYRFRIYSAGGAVANSAALAPKNDAIAYDIENPAALTLPWDVFVLNASGGSERALAHYVIRK